MTSLKLLRISEGLLCLASSNATPTQQDFKQSAEYTKINNRKYYISTIKADR
jgi:hypothetical protein